jgi:hypothetical protein
VTLSHRSTIISRGRDPQPGPMCLLSWCHALSFLPSPLSFPPPPTFRALPRVGVGAPCLCSQPVLSAGKRQTEPSRAAGRHCCHANQTHEQTREETRTSTAASRSYSCGHACLVVRAQSARRLRCLAPPAADCRGDGGTRRRGRTPIGTHQRGEHQSGTTQWSGQ